MEKDRLLAKQLSADELGLIEDEWHDSSTVMSLLGHIKYLTDIIIAARATGADHKEKGSGTNNN